MSIFSIISTEIAEFTRASFGSTVYDPSRTQPRELLVVCVVFVFHSYSVCVSPLRVVFVFMVMVMVMVMVIVVVVVMSARRVMNTHPIRLAH